MDYLRIIKRDLSNLLRDTPVEVANCEILWHINNLDDYLLSMQSKTVWTCHNILVSAEFGVLIHLPYIWRWFYLLKTIKRMVCHLVCFSFFHTFKMISSYFDYKKNSVLFCVLTHLPYIWRWNYLLKPIKRMVCHLLCFPSFHIFKTDFIFFWLWKELCAIWCAYSSYIHLKMISSS